MPDKNRPVPGAGAGDDTDGHHHDDRDYWLPDHVALSAPRIKDGFHFVPGQLVIRQQDYEEPQRGFRGILDEHRFRQHSDATVRDADDTAATPEERRGPPHVDDVLLLVMEGEAQRGVQGVRDVQDVQAVPRILDQVRTSSRSTRAPQVAPNHVFFGATHNMWGPARPVQQTDEPLPVFPDNGIGQDVKIAILDTGSADPNSVDFDLPDEDEDRKLDFEAGHGMFIEGVIRRYAPSAQIIHKRVLTTNGRVSDTSLATELAECEDVDIINLSLGGYTYDNRGAYAFNRVLNRFRRTRPHTVLVAAAGNDHTDRPFFPAAAKGVIAVAAYDPANKAKRADYSNFGWWVDARAKGDHVSAFYDARREPQYADLAAPGDLTLAAFGGKAFWSGTSFAAPVVAGAIAARMTADGLDSAREAAHRVIDDAFATYEAERGVLIEPTDYSEPPPAGAATA
jgi:subtilisin family serine protease